MKEWKGKTLCDLWDHAAEVYRDKEFVVSGLGRITYGKMDGLVNRFAAGLMHLGVKRGDKVAIWMPNNSNWALAEFAVIKSGATMVPISTRFKAYDLEYILKQSDASVLLMAGSLGKIDFYEVLLKVCPEIASNRSGVIDCKKLPLLRNVVLFDDRAMPGCLSPSQVMEMAQDVSAEELRKRSLEIRADHVINIPYTSGTTGFPKGVMLTHEQYLGQTVCFRERLGIRTGDRFIAIAPFFANFGNYFGLLLPAMVGGCSIMIESYDPALVLELIERERVTHFSGTPTMYLDIFGHPNFHGTGISSLRTAMTGAAPAPVQMVKDVYSKMGVQVLCNGYGMTENSGCTTMTECGDRPEVLAETTGRPLPGVSICIKDSATGERLEAYEVGELCTKGWLVMKGYYKMEKETKESFDHEGYFHTGDLGMLDPEGNFIITGRLKEMFISGGFNVYPVEVENFLYSMPGIKNVSITGIPDSRMGEVGMAFVVLKYDHQLSEQDIISYCKDHIAAYKVPKYVAFRSELPMAGIGKVQKYLLIEEGLKELARRGIALPI